MTPRGQEGPGGSVSPRSSGGSGFGGERSSGGSGFGRDEQQSSVGVGVGAGGGRDRSGGLDGPAGFGSLVRAEWTKFRTVRGWVIGMFVAVLATVLLGVLTASGSQCSNGPFPGQPVAKPCTGVTGPGGEAVTDNFYFVHRPMDGNGAITVRLTSLTGLYSNNLIQPGQGTAGMKSGLEPWAKAGLIIKAGTGQGSAYAAVMVTGDHGVRMQDDYTKDTAGLQGAVSAASPRWLRLTRSGDTFTGYDSPDGTHWTKVGTATLGNLPVTVQAGLFASSPPHTQLRSQSLNGSSSTGGPTQASAAFDHVSLDAGGSNGVWRGDRVGGSADPGTIIGGYHQAGGAFSVTGSGDIAPTVSGGADPGGPIEDTLVGVVAGLIAIIVIGTMFITAEYRRGLIRITLVANPRRGKVLAAKAVVIGSAAFVAGLVAAAIAIPIGVRLLRSNGNYILPVSAPTELRVVVGSAALAAVTAVLALAVGTVLRRSAAAVSAVIAVIVLPYLLATSSALPSAASGWLLRVTPAAGFAIEQSIPQYSQVANNYTPFNGYYPLSPWAGFAVSCGWAAAALGLAVYLLRRRDA